MGQVEGSREQGHREDLWGRSRWHGPLGRRAANRGRRDRCLCPLLGRRSLLQGGLRMACELGLRFDDPTHVVVTLNHSRQVQTARGQVFAAPFDAEAQRDLQWYFEVYPVQYTTEIDDERARRIAERIPPWGAALFDAVFADREPERMFNDFQDASDEGKLFTISSDHPTVLAQPWELLRDPKGTFLFLDKPRISVRRQLAGAGGGRRPFKARPKGRLHLLFVVSRPKDAGFIDPRADARAVMDAIYAEAPGRVTFEFL